MLKRRIKTIGKDVENFHAATTISISDTKNSVMFEVDAKMDNYRPLFTQPRPLAAPQQELYSAAGNDCDINRSTQPKAAVACLSKKANQKNGQACVKWMVTNQK